MANGLTIEIADYGRAAHANAIAILMRGYSGDPMGGAEPLSQSHCNNIAGALENYGYAYTVLAFSESGEPIGLVTSLKSFSTFSLKPVLNLHDVFVEPDWRARGVAAAMLAEVEALAVKLGCCKLTLEVLSNNSAAQALYKKFGFAPYELEQSAGCAHFWQKPITG